MNTYKELKNRFVESLNNTFTLREKDQLFFLLTEHYFQLKRLDFLTDPARIMKEDSSDILNRCTEKLNAGIPVQHITHVGYFRDLELFVDQTVLIPRPETEELVQLAIHDIHPSSRVLDIGTGSGCIALSLKSEIPQLTVSAIDYSKEALSTAERNRTDLNLDVSFHYLSMTDSLSTLGEFDVIISNPPYIGLDERNSLDENVIAHDPEMALFSTTDDALFFYKAIYNRSLELLVSGGMVFLELHENYANQTADLFQTEKFRDVEILTDLQGKQRFLKAVKV